MHSRTCIGHDESSSLVSEHAAAPQVSPVRVVGSVVGGHGRRQALGVSLGVILGREGALDFGGGVGQRVEQFFPHGVAEAVGLLGPGGRIQKQGIA